MTSFAVGRYVGVWSPYGIQTQPGCWVSTIQGARFAHSKMAARSAE